jgi:hypothetical protein
VGAKALVKAPQTSVSHHEWWMQLISNFWLSVIKDLGDHLLFRSLISFAGLVEFAAVGLFPLRDYFGRLQESSGTRSLK